MLEIHNFSDFVLWANASMYQGYKKAAFCVFADELKYTDFSCDIASYNARIIDMLSLPQADNLFFTRDISGKIIQGWNISLILN